MAAIKNARIKLFRSTVGELGERISRSRDRDSNGRSREDDRKFRAWGHNEDRK